MFAASVLVALSRPDDRDPMATFAQTVDQAADRHRHAIDFGRIRLGDERDIQCPHADSSQTQIQTTSTFNSATSTAALPMSLARLAR